MMLLNIYTIFYEREKKGLRELAEAVKTICAIITEILRKKNMPEDLVYLAMIESGFNPKAYSPPRPADRGNFIYETGGRYGLKVIIDR
jgi:membrane-bound lytic murein transglycosylase D